MENKKDKIDTIFIVILVLIGVSVLFIAYNCVYMWTHPLTAIESDYMIKTQTFLGISLGAELIGGFGYKTVKKKIEGTNDKNIQPNEEPAT